MSKIDWVELNLTVTEEHAEPAVKYLAENNMGFIWKRPGSDEVLPLFRRDPKHALCMAWKFRYGRSGLSPFALAWLTNDDPKRLHKFFLKTRKFHYTYCGTTNLPVVSSTIHLGWNGHFYIPHDQYHQRPDESYYLPTIREAFEKSLEMWNDAKRGGYLDDEYARTFKGWPIKKEAWQFMKGLVDAYA